SPGAVPDASPAPGLSPPAGVTAVNMERPLVVASNRGPVTCERDEDGELVEERGPGGPGTALTGAVAVTGGLGVACALSEGDGERVNESVADALDAAGRDRTPAPVYLVQDYHLSLVAAMLRLRRPDALIGHFTHPPFAGPGYLSVLPEEMAHRRLHGLLGADV